NVPTEVDGRSDLYSLGVMLYEALGGSLSDSQSSSSKSAQRPPGRALPPLHHGNPSVSLELSDLIHKCLAEAPADRYPTAAALAADLRRHLNDQPLREVATRSLRERWRKWRRGRPHMLALGSMLLLVLIAAGAVGLNAWIHLHHQREEARAALAQGQEQLQRQRFPEAVQTLQHGLNLTERL